MSRVSENSSTTGITLSPSHGPVLDLGRPQRVKGEPGV